MPVLVSTMVPVVPVGAWVSSVTLRAPDERTASRTSSGIDRMKPESRYRSASKAGKLPFSAASSAVAWYASTAMVR